MAVYAVGDIQGCYDELQILLETAHFDPQHDHMWFVGDLVNRGPKSLKTLRLIKSLGDAAVCVLGNHDLHLLALALTGDTPVSSGNLDKVLQSKDSEELIDWLRHRPLAHFDEQLNTLMVHAGVIANWSVEKVLARASEVEQALRGKNPEKFLTDMYGKKPNHWSKDLRGNDRLRFITNCLTRIRFVTSDGQLDFDENIGPKDAPKNLLPWFLAPKRKTAKTRIVFGHWSTLGLMDKPGLLALDTGCVWGGALTAVRLDGPGVLIEVPSQQPKKF
jgi:bis(5'-nucleosyl)-tetraphosphatase (symmetrical)